MLVSNTAQMREADRIMMEDYHFPSLVLMERAGEKAFDIIIKQYSDRRYFIVLAGFGNNGGDGMVIARYLKLAGKKVIVIFPDEPTGRLKADPHHQLQIIRKLNIEYYSIKDQKAKDIVKKWQERDCVIIDALLGIGINQKVKSPYIEIIEYFKHITTDVVAIDLPSGLIGDSGAVLTEPIKAKITVSFQLPKICHYVTPASLYCGEVKTVDIGIFPNVISNIGIRTHLIEDEDVKAWHKKRKEDSYKNLFGHIIVCGGSKGKVGASVLSGLAAMRMGAGLVSILIPTRFEQKINNSFPEIMTIPYGRDTLMTLNKGAAEYLTSELKNIKKPILLIGPGLGKNKDTTEFLKIILKNSNYPMVLDADALNIIAENTDLWECVPENSIITPHPGEAARLLHITTEQLQNNRLKYSTTLATSKKVTVVLKGKGTIVSSPNRGAFIAKAGGPALAKAGMGDVLAGIIAGLLGQGYSPLRAATIGVHIHAKTGDILQQTLGEEGILPSDIIHNAPKTLKNILNYDTNN